VCDSHPPVSERQEKLEKNARNAVPWRDLRNRRRRDVRKKDL